MKTQHITAALEALLASAVLAAAQGTTAFTYQGRLDSGGGAATGLYEMSFTLYDSTTNGNVVAVPVTVAPLSVSNGLFTATLDFGANAFTGANRWLEISVTVFGSDQPVVTLDKVAALPMASWNYKAQGADVRHLGPTAQDFHAAFHLGESERTIATVDADGVALAAIQGLNRKLESELKTKEARLQALEQELAALRRLVSKLERSKN
jgi:hypothetical protein